MNKWTTGHKVALIITVICFALSAYFFGDAFDCMFGIGDYK